MTKLPDRDVRRPGFQERERAYFDDLVQRTGDTWWGNEGTAGEWRLDRRAGIVAEALRDGDRVLEFGCGAGALTKRLLHRKPHLDLTACDISSIAMSKARERCAGYPNVRFVECDILDLPDFGKFDAVVGNGILHHLPLESAIAAAAQVLSPQGRILFFEPNVVNPHVLLEKKIRPLGRLIGNTEDEAAFSRFRYATSLAAASYIAISVQPFDFIHPRTPARLLPYMVRLGDLLENTPFLREFAGSLIIRAEYAGLAESMPT